jgi:hypothetical protein
MAENRTNLLRTRDQIQALAILQQAAVSERSQEPLQLERQATHRDVRSLAI